MKIVLYCKDKRKTCCALNGELFASCIEEVAQYLTGAQNDGSLLTMRSSRLAEIVQDMILHEVTLIRKASE